MSRRWVAVCIVALLTLGAVQSRAQEAKEEKKDAKAVNIDGTWKWSFSRQDGQTREQTLKLKRDGDKLTGSVIGGRQGRETAIMDGKVNPDGTIVFLVVREFNNNTFTQKYQGKLEGDTIQGTISGERRGEPYSREWEARRVADVGGTWRLERTLDNGQTFTSTLRLKQEGNTVTGTTQWGDREPVEIENGKIEGNKLTFDVTREFNGQKWTAKYNADVTPDALKGTVTAMGRDGEERTWDTEYNRVKE